MKHAMLRYAVFESNVSFFTNENHSIRFTHNYFFTYSIKHDNRYNQDDKRINLINMSEEELFLLSTSENFDVYLFKALQKIAYDLLHNYVEDIYGDIMVEY